MKAKLIILILLLHLSVFPGISQIRFIEVNPTTDEISIKNFGTSSIDISSYMLCSKFAYTPNLSSLTVIKGTFNLNAGDTVKFSGFSIDNSAADLGLYLSSAFSDPAAMVDFLQWGSAGNGRESVANTKGIWTSGDFISSPDPFKYTGDGSQNGVSFWTSVVAGISSPLLKDAEVNFYPNPASSKVVIELEQSFDFIAVSVFNIEGKKVEVKNTYSGNTVNLPVNDLSDGIYTISLYTKEGKLIVSREIFVDHN